MTEDLTVWLQFAEWCSGLAMSQAYRESTWLFAVTQSLHLVAVATFMGAILILDLRLLGWGPVSQPRAGIARGAQPILLWAGLATLLTGFPQFTTNALTYAQSPIFVFKMRLLAVALVFTVTLRRRVALADADRLPAWMPRAVGVSSIALWMGVAICGRLIAYL